MDESLVLIDSSVWIEGLRAKALENVKTQLRGLMETGRIRMTEMIRLEVIGGARSYEELDWLRIELEEVPLLETTEREWRRAEDLSFTLSRKGQHVASADVLIAAVALCYKIPLWHADQDFERIRQAILDFQTYWYPKQSPAL